MALPKQHRLRHRRDFSRVYRSGLRRKSRHLTLRALYVSDGHSSSQPALLYPFTNEQESNAVPSPQPVFPTRVGITISTKVSKRAVVRNRIKRQLKSAMLQLLPALSHGWMLVIVVRPGSDECDYWQFLRELEEMIKNLR